MTSPDSNVRMSMKADAEALLQEHAHGKRGYLCTYALDEPWDILLSVPPHVQNFRRSLYKPASSLRFLENIADGKTIAIVWNEGLLGISFETQLNILGRIEAGKLFLEKHPRRKRTKDEHSMRQKVIDSLYYLESFERDFSAFQVEYQEAIIRGLTIRTESHPQSPQLDSTALWRTRSAYSIDPALLPYSRFDHEGRDLRGNPPSRESEGKFEELLKQLSPKRPSFLSQIKSVILRRGQPKAGRT